MSLMLTRCVLEEDNDTSLSATEKAVQVIRVIMCEPLKMKM